MREQLASTSVAIEEYEHLNRSKLGRKGSGSANDTDHPLVLEKAMVAKTLAEIDALDKTDGRAMALQMERIRHELQLLGTQHIQSMISGVIDSLPSLAKELGKNAPLSIIEDHGVVVRQEIGEVLNNVFMHLYRNSLDHGIEPPEQRQVDGKPAQGTIRLSLALDANQFKLRLADDGKGLSLGFIKQHAVEQSLLSAEASPSDEEVAQLIFASGFSTAERVTAVSGRGVGMDAVRGFIQSIGGDIELRFTGAPTDKGYRSFETLISLPAKYAVQSMPAAVAALLAHEPAVA